MKNKIQFQFIFIICEGQSNTHKNSQFLQFSSTFLCTLSLKCPR